MTKDSFVESERGRTSVRSRGFLSIMRSSVFRSRPPVSPYRYVSYLVSTSPTPVAYSRGPSTEPRPAAALSRPRTAGEDQMASPIRVIPQYSIFIPESNLVSGEFYRPVWAAPAFDSASRDMDSISPSDRMHYPRQIEN